MEIVYKEKMIKKKSTPRKDKVETQVKDSENKIIRVLYKKTGEFPKAKFIEDLEYLKKYIVLEKLDIIPYQDAFILCNNQSEFRVGVPVNVYLDLRHICGDLIVININKNNRTFNSLSQKQLLYYSEDLMRKEPPKETEINYCTYLTKAKKTCEDFCEDDEDE